MVKQNEKLSKTFQALSDPIRRDILERLTEHPASVSTIALPYKVSLPAISKHLKVLHEASLVRRHKLGRNQYISLNPRGMKQVADYSAFYEKFWNKQLDNLETYLRKEVKQHGRTKRNGK